MLAIFRYLLSSAVMSHRTSTAVHPVPTSTPLKNRYSHPIPSFCYVVEKKRRHILPICHFLCFFFISINLNNSMHFRQSSNNKYLYLLLFQSHCRWDSLFQTCLSFPVFQSRYRMRLSILEVDTDRTGVLMFCNAAIYCAQPDQHCSHQKNISQAAGQLPVICTIFQT